VLDVLPYTDFINDYCKCNFCYFEKHIREQAQSEDFPSRPHFWIWEKKKIEFAFWVSQVLGVLE
jgi:hypothetical protein